MSHGNSLLRRCAAVAGRAPAVALGLLLAAYRAVVSPWLGPCCRFAPSCSAYASEAIARYGAARGSWMALKRLLRCHPFHPGGWDPVIRPAPSAPDSGHVPARRRPAVTLGHAAHSTAE